MYLSNFHKKILKAIDNSEIKNLEGYLLNQKLYFKEEVSTIAEEHVFAGLELKIERGKTKKYIIKSDKRNEVFIKFKEFMLLLKFLEENNMITMIKDSVNKGFLPIFIVYDDEKEEIFDDVLNLVKQYLNKEICKMEGFKKFKELGYRTHTEAHEKKIRFLLGFWIPFLFFILKALIDFMFKVCPYFKS